jgi:hypothetical protein
MSFLANILIIAGMLSVDGQPIPDQSLMLVDPVKNVIVATTETDEDGHFTIAYKAPQDGHDYTLLAKFRHEDIATVEAKEIMTTANHPKVDFQLSSSDLIAIEGKVKAKRMKPMQYLLDIDLVKVQGVDPKLIPFLKRETENIIRWNYQTRDIRSDTFRILTKPGTITVDATRVYLDDPLAVAHRRNYVSERVRVMPQKMELSGKPYIGFSLEVNAPTKIEVIMKCDHDED